MRIPSIVALVLLMGLGPRTAAYSDDGAASWTLTEEEVDETGEALTGTPIDGQFTLKIHLPDSNRRNPLDLEARNDDETRPCGGGVISVPGIVQGQHVAVPRAADGSCPRFTTEIVSEDPPTEIEFEPEGCMASAPRTCTHFLAHGITETTSEYPDYDRCEVVIEQAIMRETVRRKALRHVTPQQIADVLGEPPASR